LTDEDKIKNAIDVYFKLRYEGQKLLEAQNFSFLIANDPQTQAWAQREKDKREVELYNAATYRLNYVKYEYFLDYDSIAVENGVDATVRLHESHNVVFEVIAPEVSSLGGLEHIIMLSKTETGWVIVQDKYEDMLAKIMVDETKDEIIARIQSNHVAELQRAASAKKPFCFDSEMTLDGGHAYNRWAAVGYADTYALPPYNSNYEYIAGNDCTNFVSQAIYEGVSHTMSAPNNYYNDWYYDFYTKTGSYPWINVPGLYSFLTGNNGRGPYGHRVTNLCSVHPGDVVQIYHNNRGWHHTVIVVVVGEGDYCWYPEYTRVDAHSNDYRNYPLAAYYPDAMRYIVIDGWRD